MFDFHALFSYICHQDPERSFLFLWDPPFLCARCTGFYSGIIIGSGYLLIKTKLKLKYLLIITGFSLVIVAINVCIERIFLIDTGNAIRAITGLFAGICVGGLFVQNFKREGL
jgi:uncharacterized membrane protein